VKEKIATLLTDPRMPSKTTILTSVGAAGVMTTAVLSARGAQQATYCLDTEMLSRPRIERMKLTWRCYVPAAVSGSLTIAAIFGAHRFSGKQTAALTAAFQLSEKAYAEYREKVEETYGKTKELKIRDEIAQDRISASPNNTVVVTGTEVLCCELHTMRYFKSSMEELRSAQNTINARLNRHGYAYLSDLYEILSLENTSEAYAQGWKDEKLLDLEFTSVLAEGASPCLAFNYNYTTVI